MNWCEQISTYGRLLHYRFQAERAEMRFLLSRAYMGGSVLDVGAHRGESSYWMHRQFHDGTRVVAFEPQRELVEFLTCFQQSFHLDRLHIEPIGLSSQTGTLRMHRARSHWDAATVDEFCFDNLETEVFDVPVTTIDKYLAEHPELRPVRFIKIDVGGHEAEVLEGAKRTLREDRPELLVEWSTPRRAYRERLFSLLQQLGYAAYQFESGRLAECASAERHDPPSWELGANYVMLPNAALEAENISRSGATTESLPHRPNVLVA